MTRAIPNPSPAIASGQVRADTLVVAVSCRSTSRRPRPASRQPSTIGSRAADARRPVAGNRPGHDHRNGERREHERDLVAGEVRDQLQVERGEEEDGEDREVGGEGDDVRRGEGRVAEELDPQHRVGRPPLDLHECHGEECGEHEEAVDPPRPVAPVLAADDGEGRGDDRRGARGQAGHVEPPSYRVTAFGERHRGHTERERAEAEAEPEDALPAGARDEDAADHRAEREREPRDGSPDTECERPLSPLRIDVADQRERARLRAPLHRLPSRSGRR